MRNLALLVRKDFLSAFSVYGNMAIMLVIWLIVMAVTPNMAPLMFIMLIYIMVVNLFASEENDLVCNVAGILPIRKSQAVVARYLYTYLLLLAGFMLGSLIAGISAAARGTGGDWFTPVVFGAASALLMVSVIMPLNYRFGVVKARYVSMAVYLVMVVASTAVSPLLLLFGPTSAQPPAFLALAAGVLASLISLAIAVRVRRP